MIDVIFVIPARQSLLQPAPGTGRLNIDIPWGEDVDASPVESSPSNQVGAWLVNSKEVTSKLPPLGSSPTGQNDAALANLSRVIENATKGLVPNATSGNYQALSFYPRQEQKPGYRFPISAQLGNKPSYDEDDYIIVHYSIRRLPTKLFQVSTNYFNKTVNLFHWADSDLSVDYLLMEVIYPKWQPKGIGKLFRGLLNSLNHQHDLTGPLIDYGVLDRPDDQLIYRNTEDDHCFQIGSVRTNLAGGPLYRKLVFFISYRQDVITWKAIIHACLAVLYVWILGHYILEFFWTMYENYDGLKPGEHSATSRVSAGVGEMLFGRNGLLFVAFAGLVVICVSLIFLRILEQWGTSRRKRLSDQYR